MGILYMSSQNTPNTGSSMGISTNHQQVCLKNYRHKHSSEGGLFPSVMHDLLDYVENNGMEHIVSWTHNGTAFTVHDPTQLTEMILPAFFNQSQFRSFQRQLNSWFFDRIQLGNGNACFRHPYFIKGRKSMCQHMSRESFKREPLVKRIKATSSSSSKKQKKAVVVSKEARTIQKTTTLLEGKLQEVSFSSKGSQQQFQQQQHDMSVFPGPMSINQAIELASAAATKPTSIVQSFHDVSANISLEPTSIFGDDIFSRDASWPLKEGDDFQEGDMLEFEGRCFHFLDVDSIRQQQQVLRR